MKLCVFQGTFNPIHRAHLRLGNYVADKYNFDKILFIPACNPPHKDCDNSYSVHRLNMVKLAVKNNKNFEVCDIEYKRDGKSYTYLTICELYDKFHIEGKINFIIGTDAFEYIESWYKADKLKELIKFIVFIRENNFDSKRFEYLKAQGYDFEFENLSYDEVSASDLREKILDGQSISNYVTKEVEEYILKNGLYKS